MNFNDEITAFEAQIKGEITILDEVSGIVAYADSRFNEEYSCKLAGRQAKDIFGWYSECPRLAIGEISEWEYASNRLEKYYKINSTLFEKEGRTYSIHSFEDITPYMALNSDIVGYMDFFRKISEFQNMVIGKLNVTYYELLPVAAEYFKVNFACFMVEYNGYVNVKSYNAGTESFTNDRFEIDERSAKVFDDYQNVEVDGSIAPEDILPDLTRFKQVCRGQVADQRYVIYIDSDNAPQMDPFQEDSIKNIIRLYVENGIMKEKMVYDATHDGMTGLCNKARYLDMAQNTYRNLDSIAIYNLDVNDLKKTNDNLGHEAGDRLLKKAADSIRKVTSDKVQGYRMGGDEYLIVACNVTEEEALDIKNRWEAALDRLNQADDGIHCVIAIGMVYALKGYDYDELMKQADALMYEDKKAKKAPGDEIR